MTVTKCYKKKRKTEMSQDWEGSVEIGRGKIFVWDSPSVISAIECAIGVRRVTRRLTVTRGSNIDRGTSRKEGKSREYTNRKRWVA